VGEGSGVGEAGVEDLEMTVRETVAKIEREMGREVDRG